MSIIYQGTDITELIDVQGAQATDCEGGRADELRLQLSDVAKMWDQWKPQRGDEIRLVENGYDSGIMYLDEITSGPSECTLRAASINHTARVESYQAWEGITLRRLILDFAARYGLTPDLFDVPDVSYQRIAQYGDYDMAWLSRRCMMEGCALKIYDGRLVVYEQRKAEQGASVATIELTNNTPYTYREVGHLARSGCVLESGAVRGRFDAPDGTGPVMVVRDVAAGSIAEAKRYARGLLREQNKRMVTLSVRQILDGVYAAGECVNVEGSVAADGIWFVSSVLYDFIGEMVALELRRPIPW